LHVICDDVENKFFFFYTYVFGVKLSSSGTSGFVGRRCVLEIKMAAKLPEVQITLLILQIHMLFQKQYMGL